MGSWVRYAGFFLLFASLCALWNSSPGLIGSKDFIAYFTGIEVFWSGGDPYSYEGLFAVQQELHVARDAPVMVWNPPSFFVTWGFFFGSDPRLALSIATFFSVLSIAGLVACGVWMGTRGEVTPFPTVVFIGLATCFPAAIEELSLCQITSWIALPVMAGAVLACSSLGPRWVSGALMAYAISKPHNVALPCVVVAAEMYRRREWSFFFGVFLGLVLPAVGAEMLRPGIWEMWLFRSEWPQQAIGANLSGLLRLALGDVKGEMVPAFAIGSACLGVYAVRHACQALDAREAVERFMVAMLIWPFFSPYGFFNDQIVTIAPLAFFLSKRMVSWEVKFARILVYRLAGLFFVIYVADTVTVWPARLSWFLLIPGVYAIMRCQPVDYQRKAVANAPA